MAQVLDPPSLISLERSPRPKRWTRQDCRFLRENGLLNGRYELISGELLEKMSNNPPHRIALIATHKWLIATFGHDYIQAQCSIDVRECDLDFNEPEPDFAITRQPTTAYRKRNPAPRDLVLVIEVSDSTLDFDRTTKARLYGQAGIPEYWVLDLAGERLIVHRSPGTEGYAEIVAYGADEEVATLARPEVAVRVVELLPPEEQGH